MELELSVGNEVRGKKGVIARFQVGGTAWAITRKHKNNIVRLENFK